MVTAEQRKDGPRIRPPEPPFEFRLNNREICRVSLGEVAGPDGKAFAIASIRKFYPDATTGEWKPSTKGIAIAREHLPELHRAVTALAGLAAQSETEAGPSENGLSRQG